ncbi:hypothetical protein HGP16_11290 [Rhizobium sp. P40RR-XXII]|uniref:hypothetical protein n=1 Tax=Rhizobium sp. P40RR-XXII TaxID=2726739 RepID=UPI001456E907|nr:hypothetical protein [Rhizobium sp. P40RR-XXII]NLS17141.1 hypothetical protein [Rhizobium sp. P40RR-XXII]
MINVFLSVRPTAALDESNGAGFFWVIIDALVDTNDVEEYIARSQAAADLSFAFVADATNPADLRAVPFPDDMNLTITLEFADGTSNTMLLPRRDRYHFFDRAAFLDLNRSEIWKSGRQDELDKIDAGFDQSPAFRNEALRTLLRRGPTEGESKDFKDHLLRSSGLGATRLISDAVFDRSGLDECIMLFGVGSDGTWGTNQHSLDGQLVRCALAASDPTRITVYLEGLAVQDTISREVVPPTLARQAHLAGFLKSAPTAPEISVTQNDVVANRLYAHGRWENGARGPIDHPKLATLFAFADVITDPTSPCAGANGRSVMRVVAPDKDARWDLPANQYLSFVALRQVKGRLKPYRGTIAASPTDNKLWVFEAQDGSQVAENLVLTATLQLIVKADAAGTLLYENGQASLLQAVGTFNFPWEGAFDKEKRTILFWSDKDAVQACDVTLLFDCGFGGGYLWRQANKLPGQKTFWQANADDDGSTSEDANCVILLDVDGNPPGGLGDLSAQILRLAAVDFELANSAARYESRIDCLTYAPRYSAARAAAGGPGPRPGFGAFNDYRPAFGWQGTAASFPPFQAVDDAQTNPISTGWPADVKQSAYHISLRQTLWDKAEDIALPDLAEAFYAALGQGLSIEHVFRNPLGQSAAGLDNGSAFGFRWSHFATITKPTNIRVTNSAGVDTQFLLLSVDEQNQELVLTADLDILRHSANTSDWPAEWMAWKYVAELGHAADLSLQVELLKFDSSAVVAQIPASVDQAPVLTGFDYSQFDGTFSLNAYKPIFLSWLKSPPAGGKAEIARCSLKLKGVNAGRVTDVAHAIRVQMFIARADETLPLGWAGDHTLEATFRPNYDVLEPGVAPRQNNDTALLCAADQWMASIRNGLFYLLPPGGQLLSLSSVALEQKDSAPEFLAPFVSVPLPAPGELIASLAPVAVRPLARHDQMGILTRHVVDRLFNLLALAVNCAVPDWWGKWSVSDWQAYFSYMPTRGATGTAFDSLVDALIAMLAVVPSTEGQSDGAAALIGMTDGRLQETGSRMRVQLRDWIWSNLEQGPQSCACIVALLSSNIGQTLPIDLWQMTYALGSSGALDKPVNATATVTELSKAVQLFSSGTSFAVMSSLNRAKFTQGVTIERISAMRGAAATNPNATGDQAYLDVKWAELPGGIDTLKPSQPRIGVALPPLSQFIPPQFLSVARRQLEGTASAFFPPPGQKVSMAGLEASNIVSPATATEPACIVIATGKTAQQPASRYDASIRVATFKVRLPAEAGADALTRVYFEFLAQQPPAADPSTQFQGRAKDLLDLLSGDGAIEDLDGVAELKPQGTDYLFFSDATLADIVRLGPTYSPMDDQRVYGLRWEAGNAGAWNPRFDLSDRVLWSEVGLSQAPGAVDEFYLTIVLQMAVWDQQPLWLRQSRGLFSLQRIGPQFIDHGTVAATGLEAIANASADYSSGPLSTLPVVTVPKGISVSDLIATVVAADVIGPNEPWGQFDAKGTISHRMTPRYPTVSATGVSFSDTLSAFARDASYPLISIHNGPGIFGGLPFDSGHVDMVLDVAWFSNDSSTPFFEVKGRKFKVGA